MKWMSVPLLLLPLLSFADASIIGGIPVKPGEAIARSIVGVVDSFTKMTCSASILSNSLAVTAAHCVAASVAEDVYVIFGTDINVSKDRRRIVGYRIYQNSRNILDEPKNVGDIAVVKFSGGLPSGYAPAELVADSELIKTGAVVTLAGYGMSNATTKEGVGILRKANTQIVDATWSKTEILIDQSKGKGACRGDSGGPAYLASPKSLLLFGVTSRGIKDPNYQCNAYVAYTNVLSYLSWIRRVGPEIGDDCRWPEDNCSASLQPNFIF
jgi:secreted trypsin-like serine protease